MSRFMKQTETESSIAPPASRRAARSRIGGAHSASGAPVSAGRTRGSCWGALECVLAVLAGITVLSRSRARAELESDTLENLVAYGEHHPSQTNAGADRA